MTKTSRHASLGLASLFLCLLTFPAVAQRSEAKPSAETTESQSPISTISVKVNVVNVLATVRDKHGEVVPNLTQNDFTLTEDGRPQTIKYFAHESDLPLTLGLMVDTSMSQRRVLGQERDASRSFVVRMVREDTDKAFVIHFDHEVELLQDLTSSHEKLESSLDNLETPQLTRTSSSGGNGGNNDPGGYGRGSGRSHGGGHFGGGTLLYDSVYLGADEIMKKQQGRKAMIILTDGVDMGSKESLDYAIETAQRSDTVVYSILFKDEEGYGGSGGGFGRPSIGGMGRRGGMGRPYPQQQERPDGKKVLDRISKETGGRMFEVSKKESIEQIYAQIEQELRHQYNLGYTPDRGGNNASDYHKLQLTAKKKDLTVQARDGYYGNH